MSRTLIVGAGAAGMAAAISAARQGQSVTVLERNEKTLKKLGVTGNGRGNLLNSGHPLYYGDAGFAAQILSRVPYERLAGFFEELGVPLREESEGRVYPAALQGAVAVDALRLRARQLGVQVCTRTRVVRLLSQEGGFLLEAEESLPQEEGSKGKKAPAAEVIRRKYKADRVVVAAGGAAAPAHGTDGSAYGLLTAFGHALTPIRPALCALLTEKKRIDGLAGQRVRARLTLRDRQGKLLHETQGEALFAQDGVSGIAAMQLARWVTDGCVLHMDLREELNREAMEVRELRGYLQTMADSRRELPLSELFTGMLMPQVGRAVLGAAGYLEPNRLIGSLPPKACEAIAATLAEFSLAVEGLRGFDSAQVTAGGIATADFDPATLESRLQKGLYAAGEILDVDGDCGGFNLMFAFASGLLAGGGFQAP